MVEVEDGDEVEVEVEEEDGDEVEEEVEETAVDSVVVMAGTVEVASADVPVEVAVAVSVVFLVDVAWVADSWVMVDCWVVVSWVVVVSVEVSWVVDCWVVDCWVVDSWVVDSWVVDSWVVDSWLVCAVEAATFVEEATEAAVEGLESLVVVCVTVWSTTVVDETWLEESVVVLSFWRLARPAIDVAWAVARVPSWLKALGK